MSNGRLFCRFVYYYYRAIKTVIYLSHFLNNLSNNNGKLITPLHLPNHACIIDFFSSLREYL